jgi:TolA-binding protein
VEEIEKDLLRIDPGERITLKVVDYDMDSSGQQDTLPIKVQIGDTPPRTLTATETENTSGEFKIEIDTLPLGGEKTAEALLVKPGDPVYFTYRDEENTFPGHAIDRTSVVYVREPTPAKMRIIETRYSPPREEGRPPSITWLHKSSGEVKGVAYEVPLTIEIIDEDAARNSLSEVIAEVSLDGAPEGASPVEVACTVSSAFSDLDETLTNVNNPALHQGRFIGQVTMKLGGNGSPRIVPLEPGRRDTNIGRVLPPWEEDPITGQMARSSPEIETGMLGVLNLTGANTIKVSYFDEETPDTNSLSHSDSARMLGSADLAATDISYEESIEKLQVGEKLFVRLSDPDRDQTSERDKVELTVTSPNGEKESVYLEETLSHSGIFTGSFKLKAKPQPTAGNFDPVSSELEVFFGQELKIVYSDPVPANQSEALTHRVSVPVSDGTDGEVAAFTKIFGNESLAIQTQFHIAESYFELFKSHLKLGRKEEADSDLINGRRILRELQEDYPDPKYAPRVAYLLGQFSQELKNWEEAIDAYETIVKQYPDHSLAADSQYKLGQCYEEAGRLDEALEAYVTLAATYPQNPLISNVMIRINDHFYKKEDFEVAAQVGSRFLERFENHEWAPRMAFRVGQCYYKDEEYKIAGTAFDDFVKRFPEDDLTAQALFWSGESYRQGRDNRVAFQRYNRCRWDFPESDAAKYSRGRLALPEMIQQFEREAQAVEMEEQ